MNLTIFADGGSRGNPGPAACGFVISKTNEFWSESLSDLNDFKNKSTLLISEGKKLGKTTNNQAEWQGLVLALKKICNYLDFKTEQVENLQIFLDSQLVVRQVTGQYKVKKPELKPYFLEVKDSLKKFKKWQIFHIPREYNSQADKVLNNVLDSV
jgi:ribonuclease HI